MLGQEWYVPSTGKTYKRVTDGITEVWLDISATGSGLANNSEEFVIGTASGNYDGLSTTVFPTVNTFNSSFANVYMNGSKLSASDYVADGISITLAVAGSVGDVVAIETFNTFSIGDAYTKAEVDAGYAEKNGDITQTFKAKDGVVDDDVVNKGQTVQKTGDTMLGELIIGSGSTTADLTLRANSSDNGRLTFKRNDNTLAYRLQWNYYNDSFELKKYNTSGNLISETIIGDDIGKNQTWRDLTTSSAINTVYTNTTDKPIMISVSNNYDGTFEVDGVRVGRYHASSTFISASFIVPVGSTYEFKQSEQGVDGVFTWAELK